MSTLIIIRGNSGSGKTTIAKRLQRELGRGTMLVSQDVIRREILRVQDVPNNPSRGLIMETARYGKKVGYNVIIEGILTRHRYGDSLRQLASEFDRVLVYYFDIPFEETMRRHASKPNAHEFGEEEMRQWWREKDALDMPGEQIILQYQSEDEVVAQIVRDCQ